MLFNSDIFFKFFAAFLLLYFIVRHNLAGRNFLIIAASYLFYGWWDVRFLALLFISSILDYTVGLGLSRTERPARRRLWLSLSLTGNLGMLGFFKYYGFFADSLIALFQRFGLQPPLQTWHIILPVGISFYTFQTMSYVLDVYRRKSPATRDILSFLAYVSFFPQLVAGPIERVAHMLPQFETSRTITRSMLAEGLWLMIWGMFKKVVVADNLAPLVELVYQHPTNSGLMVVLGTIAFGLQIYGDFSGYSDIARGLAKLLGFDLMVNFNLPYLASNVRDFWRRWHISLSTWLRDYLYISLGGNKSGPTRTGVNLFATMLLGGLWHGAAWNFVLWGFWHGAGLLVQRRWSELRLGASQPNLAPTKSGNGSAQSSPHQLSIIVSWVITMSFVFYGWLLFRATSFEQIVSLTSALTHGGSPTWFWSYVANLIAFSAPLVLMQAWQNRTGNLLAPLTLPAWAMSCLEGAMIFTIVVFWRKDSSPFIYFQF